MRRSLTITAVSLAAVTAVAAGVTSLSAAPASRDAEAVKALELKRFEAATKNDLEGLAKLLGDDLTYTHSSGVLDDKAKFLDAIKTGKTKYVTIEPSDLQVRVYGSAAVITGQAKISLVSAGTPKDLALRFTDVWAKRAGKWQMVAWQSTRLP